MGGSRGYGANPPAVARIHRGMRTAYRKRCPCLWKRRPTPLLVTQHGRNLPQPLPFVSNWTYPLAPPFRHQGTRTHVRVIAALRVFRAFRGCPFRAASLAYSHCVTQTDHLSVYFENSSDSWNFAIPISPLCNVTTTRVVTASITRGVVLFLHSADFLCQVSLSGSIT